MFEPPGVIVVIVLWSSLSLLLRDPLNHFNQINLFKQFNQFDQKKFPLYEQILCSDSKSEHLTELHVSDKILSKLSAENRLN